MPDKIKILYDAVSKNYNVGSFDEFANKLQDPTKRKSFYEGVGAEYNLGDFDTFTSKVSKKATSVDLGNGLQSFSGGAEPFQNSPQNTLAPSVLTPQAQQEYVRQKESEKENLSRRLQTAQGAFRAAQGDELAHQILSTSETNQGSIEPYKEQSFLESASNSVSNVGKRLQGAIPRLNIVAADVWENVLGKEAAKGYYNLEGRDIEKVRSDAYQKLADLDASTKPVQGLTENIKNFNIPGLAAGVVDAMGQLASTAIPSIVTGGAGLVTEMEGQSIVDYNKAKAKSKGISVDELYKSGQADLGVPLAIGTLATGLEFIGLKGAEKAINAKLTGSALKKFAHLFTEVNKEGTTEWVQTGLDQINTQLAEGKDIEDATKSGVDQMFSKKGLESYLMGVAGSGGAAGLGRVAKGILSPKAKESAGKNVEAIERLQQEAEATTNPNTAEFVQKEIKKNVDEIATHVDEDAEKVDQLPDEHKQIVNTISDNIEKAETVAQDPALSDESRKVAEEEVKVLNTTLEETIDQGEKASKILAKAEDDLEALKQVENKTKKYEGSLKRLTEAKKSGEITENQFTELKNRFDDVIGESKPTVEEVTVNEEVQQEPAEEPKATVSEKTAATQHEVGEVKAKKVDLFIPNIVNGGKSYGSKTKIPGASMFELEKREDGNYDVYIHKEGESIIANNKNDTILPLYNERNGFSGKEKIIITKPAIVSIVDGKINIIEKGDVHYGEINKSVESPKREGSETVAEAPVEAPKAVISDKVEELVAQPKVTDKELKAQKKDMLTQLSEVDSKFQENDDTADRIIRAKDAGYEVNDKGQITFDVEGDGTFKIHVDNIGDAIAEVQKQFPEKTPTPRDYKPKLSGANGKGKTTVTQVELDNMQENLDTATKSGNTKLQEVFSKELDRLNKLPIDEPKATVAKEEAKSPEPKGLQAKEVIKYDSPEKNKYRPSEQLKFNQGEYYEPVRLVGDEDLITLIQAGSERMRRLSAKNPPPIKIDNATMRKLEEKLGITSLEAYDQAKQLAKDNRSKTEERIVVMSDSKMSPKAENQEPSKLQSAKDKLKEAKAKLDNLNNVNKIADDPKEKARALFEYHKALVNVAKEYISEGIDNVKDFAKELGEKVTKDVRRAWEEATGDSENSKLEDFEEPEVDYEAEDADVMGITKKELKDLQDEEYQPSKKSRNESRAEAKRMIAEGVNIKDLIKKVQKDNYRPTPAEFDILRDYFVSLTARINESPTPELLKERNDLIETIRDAGMRLGQSVQALDGLVAIEDNLSSFLTEESAYTELSQEEVTELSEKYNKAQEALKKLQDKEAEARKRANDKKAQKNIDDAKKQRGSIKEDFKQERVKLREDLRDALRNARNTTQATFVPYANELIVASPIVKKLVQSYVKEGIYDLKTIVKNIHDELKEDITDLTEDDVRDMIAGEYPKPKKTKNAKLAEIYDLERQAKLEKRIEDLNNGLLDTPKSKSKKVNETILALEKEIKEIKRRNPDLTYPSRLQGRKTWFTNRINELKEQIKNKDFDLVEPPTAILLDAEALKLKDEYAKFKEETRERRQKKEYEALDKWQKGLKVLQGVAGLRRAVNVSVDLSIPLRQGISIMLNPRTAKIGADGYVKMVEAVKSRANYNRMMVDIERSPAYLESKDDGIVYNEVATSNTNDEWHQSNDILNKIPILRDLVKGSEIAAAAWTNYARHELYKKGTERLVKEGKTRENNKKAYEDMAARVMVDTGRGKIPFLKDKGAGETDSKIKQALSSTMFGPRLYSATFRKLNPLYYLNPKVDRTVRVEALKDMTGYVASQILAGLAVSALGATVSFDYDDPDFLKARWGKKVVDLTAGQSVYIRTFLRLMTAAVNRFDPTMNKEDADKYAGFAMKSVGSFWRNKLAPNTAYGVNAFMGENSIGEKFNPYEILKVWPMYTDDIIKALKEGDPLSAAIVLPIGISGLGYQEYSKDLRKARVNTYVDSKDTQVKSFLKKNKLNITGDINQEVYDINTGDKVKMTKDQSDKYETIWAEQVIRGIKADMSELAKLAEKDKKHEDEKGYEKKLNGAISKIKSEATRIAKEEITGVNPESLTVEQEVNGERKVYQLTADQVKERMKMNQKYIQDNKQYVEQDAKDMAQDEGISIEKSRIKIEKKLRSEANSESRDYFLEKGNLKEKE